MRVRLVLISIVLMAVAAGCSGKQLRRNCLRLGDSPSTKDIIFECD